MKSSARRLLALIGALAPLVCLGDDIYRCPGPSGTVYQPTPCKGGQNKGSIQGTPGQPPVATNAQAPGGDLERTKAYLADREKARKKDDLERRIAANDRDIAAAQQSMNDETAALQAKKGNARNNLAGATWEQSISAEMQAVTERYKVIIENKREDNKRLREDLAKLN